MTCQSGATAVEFALVAPILFALIIGGVSTGLLMYSAAGLHEAVEQAARCYSVNRFNAALRLKRRYMPKMSIME